MTEEKLRERETCFSIAARQARMHIWEYDFKEKMIRFVTKSGEGYCCKTEQIEGETVICNVPEVFFEAGDIHPEDRTAVKQMYQSLHNGAETATVTYRWKGIAENKYFWSKATYTTVFDKDGIPHHAVGTCVDVTEQMELENKYKETVAFHHSRLGENTVMAGHCSITHNKILDLTDLTGYHLLQQFGTQRDQFFAQISHMVVDEEERINFLGAFSHDSLKTAFAEGITSHKLECTLQFPNKEDECTLLFHVDVMRNPDTKDLIGFLTVTDVTRQRRLELVVNQAVEQDYDFIAYVNGKTKKYLCFVNENSDSHVPPDRGDDFIKDTWTYAANYIIPEDRERVLQERTLENIFQQLEKTKQYTIFYTAIKKDGSHARKKIRFSYIDKGKKTLLLSARDITDIYLEDQRKNEALSAALAAAEQANAAKTNFLSRMSHEIRTPMNAIIGMSTIAAGAMGNDAQVLDCISKIGISSRFLLSLINDILDMSRIESGKMLLKNDKIPFEEFISGINSICYTQAGGKNVDYECVVDHSVDSCYIGDAMKLQQVIINIISNAIKFTDDGGKVSFRITQRSKARDNAVLRFIVNDTGCGMSEEFIPHLFEAFSQEHAGTTTMYGGTGLGLAICKNIVDMMDGKIEVRSIKGIGTEFTVDVKLGITEEARVLHAKKQSHRFADLKTLVVDDDVTVCEHATITLREMGVKAEWVDSGKKAVDRVQEKWDKREYYDMILVDWKMPEMDGIETAKRIRKIVGPHVTIIIMTAYDWVSIEHEAKLAGVNLLMNKPMFKSSLISAFEKALGQKDGQIGFAKKDFDFTGRRILLVEDHPLNVEVATRLLESIGAAIEHAENGLKAMEMFSKTKSGYYDAILMDIRMPIMDGLQAANNIRHLSNEDAKTIPIIAMTANAFEDDVDKSKQAGMNAHLAKPIEPQTLFQTLYGFIGEGEE